MTSTRLRTGVVLAGLLLAPTACGGGRSETAATTTTAAKVTTTTVDPDIIVRRYASVVAEYGPTLAREVDGCFVEAECVADAGSAYRSIIDGFDALPAPPTRSPRWWNG